MKTPLRNVLAPALALAVSLPSFADSGPYIGAKLGRLDIDIAADVDDPSMTGFIVGYNFGSWALELERNSGEGSVTGPFGGDSIDFDIDTTAAYLAYRSTGDAYFKFKAGWLEEEIEIPDEDESISESDTGFSAGIGVGFRGEILRLELEVTRIEEDAILLGFGLLAQF